MTPFVRIEYNMFLASTSRNNEASTENRNITKIDLLKIDSYKRDKVPKLIGFFKFLFNDDKT